MLHVVECVSRNQIWQLLLHTHGREYLNWALTFVSSKGALPELSPGPFSTDSSCWFLLISHPRLDTQIPVGPLPCLVKMTELTDRDPVASTGVMANHPNQLPYLNYDYSNFDVLLHTDATMPPSDLNARLTMTPGSVSQLTRFHRPLPLLGAPTLPRPFTILLP